MPIWAWLLICAATVLLPRREATAVRLRSIRVPAAAAAVVRTASGDLCRTNRAGRFGRPRRRPAILAITVFAVVLATISSGRPLVGLSTGLVVTVVASAAARAQASRLVRARRRELRSALRLLGAELMAGARESDALRAASSPSSSGDRFRRAAAVAGVGGDVAAVFASTSPTVAIGRSVRRGRIDNDFAPLAAAWHVRSRCGAALAELVGKVENDLISVDDRWREADAAMAGPRSSAVLLAGLPVVGLTLGSAMGAHPLGWLLGTTPGSILLLVGVMFDVVGLLWMQRLVRSGPRDTR
jgi:tight adherence protein B